MGRRGLDKRSKTRVVNALQRGEVVRAERIARKMAAAGDRTLNRLTGGHGLSERRRAHAAETRAALRAAARAEDDPRAAARITRAADELRRMIRRSDQRGRRRVQRRRARGLQLTPRDRERAARLDSERAARQTPVMGRTLDGLSRIAPGAWANLRRWLQLSSEQRDRVLSSLPTPGTVILRAWKVVDDIYGAERFASLAYQSDTGEVLGAIQLALDPDEATVNGAAMIKSAYASQQESAISVVHPVVKAQRPEWTF